MRYNKKIIKKACKLYDQKVPLRKICAATGIRSTSSILFACNEGYREQMTEAGRKWRKKNPERWREICHKASNKFWNKKTNEKN